MKGCIGICVIVLALLLIVPSSFANQLTTSDFGSYAMGLRSYPSNSDLTGWSDGVIGFANPFGGPGNDKTLEIDISTVLLDRLKVDRSLWDSDGKSKKNKTVPEPGSFPLLVAGLGFVTGAAGRKPQ